MNEKLSINLLLRFRDAYKKDWPNYNITFGLFDHFINRIEKFPEWDEKVHFYNVDGNFSEDATFVFTNGYYIYFDTLTSDREKLKAILQKLDYDGEKMFVAIREAFEDLVNKISKEKFLLQIIECKMKTFYSDEDLYDIPSSEAFIAQLPNEFYISNIPESYADYIYQNNESKFIRSKEVIETALKYNPSTGIFRKSDKTLIGWMLFSEYGMPAHFHVLKEYRRQKLGSYLLTANFLQVIKCRKFYNVMIRDDNEASIKMAPTLGHGIQQIDTRVVKIVIKLQKLHGKL